MLRHSLPIALLTLLAACGETETNQLPQQSAVSECGGFVPNARAAGDYCDAEVVDWTYDAVTQKLTVVDNRAVLNCCGEHSITAHLVDGVYVIEEVDAPENAGRCNCMCVFDFEIEIEEVPAGLVGVEITRQVTDEDGTKTLLSTELDLDLGEGRVVVDETDAAPWCEASSLVQSSSLSECGGFDAESTYKAAEEYCAEELLVWSYDSEAGTANLIDQRVLLNCCGDHSIVATLTDGVYVLEEVDAPMGGDGRCDCMCVFDFGIEVEVGAAAVMPVRIVRDITDEGGGATMIWDGDLDLTQGSGEVVLDDTDVGMWCQP